MEGKDRQAPIVLQFASQRERLRGDAMNECIRVGIFNKIYYLEAWVADQARIWSTHCVSRSLGPSFSWAPIARSIVL